LSVERPIGSCGGLAIESPKGSKTKQCMRESHMRIRDDQIKKIQGLERLEQRLCKLAAVILFPAFLRCYRFIANIPALLPYYSEHSLAAVVFYFRAFPSCFPRSPAWQNFLRWFPPTAEHFSRHIVLLNLYILLPVLPSTLSNRLRNFFLVPLSGHLVPL
jgi:hypothetical protein